LKYGEPTGSGCNVIIGGDFKGSLINEVQRAFLREVRIVIGETTDFD
jgi:hypothetical protein